MAIRIKNWTKFQHFKNRRPPWIKLHREILDQRDINMISDCSFRVLVGLWLLASEDPEMNGTLPSMEDIQFRLRIDKSKLLKALKELGKFLDHDDITVISDRYHDGPPETETETETEGEIEGGKSTSKSKRKKFIPPTPEEVSEYGESIDYKISGDQFCNSYEQKGWMVGKNKMKDWKAAVRNWKANKWGLNGNEIKSALETFDFSKLEKPPLPKGLYR